MSYNHVNGEVVGWLHAPKSDEVLHALGRLGLECQRGVFVVHEGDAQLGWLIDDFGWHEPWPVEVHFTKGGLAFVNRDIDRDAAKGRAWAQPGCYQDYRDLPYTYDYDQAVQSGGYQLYLVTDGLVRATRVRNLNPYADHRPDYRACLVEVVCFPGLPPENAASLFYNDGNP